MHDVGPSSLSLMVLPPHTSPLPPLPRLHCLCTQTPLLAPHAIPPPSPVPLPPHPTLSFATWALWTPLGPPLFLSCTVWNPQTPSHPTPSQSSPRTPSSASFPSPACSGPLRPRLDPLPSSPLHSGPLGRCPGTSSPSPPSPFGPHSDPSLPRPHALGPLGPPLGPVCHPVTICTLSTLCAPPSHLSLPLTTAHPRTTLGSHLTHSLAVSPPQTPFSASFPLPAHPGPLGPPSDHPLGLVCQLAAVCTLSAPLQPTSPSPSPLWALGPLPPLSAPSASPSWPCGPTRHPRCLSLPPLPLPHHCMPLEPPPFLPSPGPIVRGGALPCHLAHLLYPLTATLPLLSWPLLHGPS